MREILFKQDYCHACDTRFAIFYPLPSYCLSSLFVRMAQQQAKQRNCAKKIPAKFCKTTLKWITKWMKRKHVKCSGLFLWKSCNVNSRCSQGLMAAPGMIHCTYILMIIFPIKTFQKQLKLLQNSLKTIFFHFCRKLCLKKWEEKVESSKDCPSSPRFPNATLQTTWETRLQYPKFWLHGGQQLKLHHDLDRCPRVGGGGTPDFKWQGWLNGGKNQNPKKSLGLQTNPKKSLDQNLTPQKCHAEFPSHKNFQRNYTARIRGEHTQELSHTGTITNLQVVLNTQKHPYLNQPTQKNTCHSFTTEKKKPKLKISHP